MWKTIQKMNGQSKTVDAAEKVAEKVKFPDQQLCPLSTRFSSKGLQCKGMNLAIDEQQ